MRCRAHTRPPPAPLPCYQPLWENVEHGVKPSAAARPLERTDADFLERCGFLYYTIHSPIDSINTLPSLTSLLWSCVALARMHTHIRVQRCTCDDLRVHTHTQKCEHKDLKTGKQPRTAS